MLQLRLDVQRFPWPVYHTGIIIIYAGPLRLRDTVCSVLFMRKYYLPFLGRTEISVKIEFKPRVTLGGTLNEQNLE